MTDVKVGRKTSLCPHCTAAIGCDDETVSHGCVGVFAMDDGTHRCSCPECRRLQRWLIEFDERRRPKRHNRGLMRDVTWEEFAASKTKRTTKKAKGVKATIDFLTNLDELVGKLKPELRFYYIRDFAKRPFITVCVAKFTGGKDGKETLYVRGIALCHPKDSPCRSDGVGRAHARVNHARAAAGDVHVVLSNDMVEHFLKGDLWRAHYQHQAGKDFVQSQFGIEKGKFRIAAFNCDVTDFEKGLFEKREKVGE